MRAYQAVKIVHGAFDGSFNGTLGEYRKALNLLATLARSREELQEKDMFVAKVNGVSKDGLQKKRGLHFDAALTNLTFVPAATSDVPKMCDRERKVAEMAIDSCKKLIAGSPGAPKIPRLLAKGLESYSTKVQALVDSVVYDLNEEKDFWESFDRSMERDKQ